MSDVAAIAEYLLLSRQRRAAALGPVCQGFGEPAWDILLRLFADEGRGEPTRVEDLVDAAGAERPTVVTYLRFLASHHAIVVDGATILEWPETISDVAVITLEARSRERLRAYLEHEAAHNMLKEKARDEAL